MEVFEDTAPLQNYLKIQRLNEKNIGLVPTMGALHEGHAALVKAAQQRGLFTVATIYVNPAQFNNPVDLEKYPRNMEKDRQFLEALGCDALFCPSDALMYPEYPPQLQMYFGHLENIMEGKFRKGHFGGVGLVLSKLFHMVRPNVAFFGQKDFQQFMVVKKLVDELVFDVELEMVPTVRNAGGLAFSSRNQRLSADKQEMAQHLHKALQLARKELLSQEDVSTTKAMIAAHFDTLEEISLEYFEVVDAENFKEVNNVSKHRQVVLCIAAYINGVRLIDNLLLFSN